MISAASNWNLIVLEFGILTEPLKSCVISEVSRQRRPFQIRKQ